MLLVLPCLAGGGTAQAQDPCPNIYPPRLDLTQRSSRLVIKGAAEFDHVGFSVGAVGDFNGDGIADILVGAPDADPANLADGGQAHVLFGSTDLTSDTAIDLGTLALGEGLTLRGPESGSLAGVSVSSAGDFNGDGLDDLIMLAPGAGTGYVVFGAQSAPPIQTLSTLTPDRGLIILEQNELQATVAAAGDLNDDGFDDIVIGLPAAVPEPNDIAGPDVGAAVVIFGRPTSPTTVANLVLPGPQAPTGLFISGLAARDALGSSVSRAGDLNDDGIGDLIIGAPGVGGDVGAAYVIFGRPTLGSAGTFDLADLGGSLGFVISGTRAGEQFGSGVAAAGDFTGDGVDDVVVAGVSEAAVLPGGATLVGSAVISLADVSGRLTLSGAGAPVSGGGDINGDGLDDIVVRTFVVFGRPMPGDDDAISSDSVDLFQLSGADGFELRANLNSALGRNGAAFGDFNDDGLDDMVIGADLATVDGTAEAGSGFVVFGRILEDCNDNAVSDACEPDCNENGQIDACEMLESRVEDCNENGIPDECEGQSDCDANGVADLCQTDSDGDGLIDGCDGCPLDPVKTEEGDCGCGVPDIDIDGDSAADCIDRCARGDDRIDADADGIPDACDNCPKVPNIAQRDGDGDGVGDLCNTEPDLDEDGIPNSEDNCPTIVNIDQLDIDGDGDGNACDIDDDGDDVVDEIDACPTTPLGTEVGSNGCPTRPNDDPPVTLVDLAIGITSESTQHSLDRATILYTVTVVNIGNVVARNVRITAEFDPRATLEEVSNGALFDDKLIAWPEFDLASGSAVTRSFAVSVNPVDLQTGDVLGIADVESDGIDEDPDNNNDRTADRFHSDQGDPTVCGTGVATAAFTLSPLLLAWGGLGRVRRREETIRTARRP